MSNRPIYNGYSGSLAAGDEENIFTVGTFVYLEEAIGQIEINVDNAGFVSIAPGQTWIFTDEAGAPQGFKTIRLRNAGMSAASYTLKVGRGQLVDNRQTASGTINVADPQTGQSFADLLDQSDISTSFIALADQTLSANQVVSITSHLSDRVRVHVFNHGPGVLRLDHGGNPNRGLPILPGTAFTVQSRAAMYAVADASGAKVSISYERRT